MEIEAYTNNADYWSMLRPDDWHVHLRDGVNMEAVAPDSASRFGRVLVMPNLEPPVVTVAAALEYRQRVLVAAATDGFNPYMALYLSPSHSTKEEVYLAAASEHILGIKYYPAGATTGSDHGVAELDSVWPILEAMQEADLPLQVHGECTEPEIDIFDREQFFLQRVLEPILAGLPRLRIVLEHISTSDAVQFVRRHAAAGASIAATITLQHMMCNRNHMFAGGLRPHLFCRPVLKSEQHRQAVLQAAISGEPYFFFGSDSAPHGRRSKESECGCAGVYSACAALELCAEIFTQNDAMPQLEYFCSMAGADFYGLPRATEKIRLRRRDWTIPDSIAYGDDELVPLAAGTKCSWSLEG
ncbi:MAG: dihydroorotase [Candidatus Porifericomitaceae bacterium WSBS_2022_MAG_OTU9]